MYAACSSRAGGLGEVGLVQGRMQAMLLAVVCGNNTLRLACPTAIKTLRANDVTMRTADWPVARAM